MSLEEKYPLIDKFILGSISDAEIKELEQLKKDSAFQNEFEYRNQVAEAAKREGRKAIKSQFKQLDGKETPIKRLIPVNLFRAIAAIGVILIAAYFVMKPMGQSIDNETIYASYYEKLPNKLTVIPRGELIETDSLGLAMIKYNSNNLEEALELFELIEEKNPDLSLNKAAIALERENLPMAILAFTPVANQPNHRFQQDAMWYLALAKLKSGNIDASILHFESLAVNDTYYGNKAKMILVDLRKK